MAPCIRYIRHNHDRGKFDVFCTLVLVYLDLVAHGTPCHHRAPMSRPQQALFYVVTFVFVRTHRRVCCQVVWPSMFEEMRWHVMSPCRFVHHTRYEYKGVNNISHTVNTTVPVFVWWFLYPVLFKTSWLCLQAVVDELGMVGAARPWYAAALMLRALCEFCHTIRSFYFAYIGSFIAVVLLELDAADRCSYIADVPTSFGGFSRWIIDAHPAVPSVLCLVDAAGGSSCAVPPQRRQ